MISQDAVISFFELREKNNQNIHETSYKFNAIYKTVDYVKNITYETFFTNFLTLNKSCIISLQETDSWKSTLEWVTNGKPNFDFLEKEFGSSVVPVADCNIREYNSQKKKSMIFKDYINYWKNLENEKNFELLYLKDWHFKREYPDYKAYETPVYFKSDWLNEFCENQTDDYQFVYMGPKGTWTPLHSDVFGSYSWSINICGCKKWILFPPGFENFLKDERKQLPYVVDENYLIEQNIFHLKIIQNAGETIFVPSGWYHQVWNLEDTISINHNWFNGCNIHYIWENLYQAALDVENEIADIKDFEGWEDQLQIILKAHHGMNYPEFLLMLQFIITARMRNIESSANTNLNWHDIFDILSIKNLCTKMENYQIPDMFLKNTKEINDNITKFLSSISEVINVCQLIN